MGFMWNSNWFRWSTWLNSEESTPLFHLYTFSKSIVYILSGILWRNIMYTNVYNLSIESPRPNCGLKNETYVHVTRFTERVSWWMTPPFVMAFIWRRIVDFKLFYHRSLHTDPETTSQLLQRHLPLPGSSHPGLHATQFWLSPTPVKSERKLSLLPDVPRGITVGNRATTCPKPWGIMT